MFYDIYLDEVFYLREEKENLFDFKPNIFDGLIQYNKKERSNYSNGKVIVLRKEKDILKFIKTSRNVLSNNEKLYYGKINKKSSFKIKQETGCVVEGFNLSLQRNNFKHIEKRHGNPIKEVTRGQINVTDYDFYLIPSIICNYDYLNFNRKAKHNKTIVFNKLFGNINYTLVVYISSKNHNIEIKTLYKTKKMR